jgi:hypothetical protein
MRFTKLLLLSFIFLSFVSANANHTDSHKNTAELQGLNTGKTSNSIIITVLSPDSVLVNAKLINTSSTIVLTTRQQPEKTHLVPVYQRNASPNFYNSMLIFNDKLQQCLTTVKEIELKNLINRFKALVVL